MLIEGNFIIMEIILIISILSIIIISILMNTSIKKLEKIALDEELNKISEKYPNNIEICKEILKKLKNEKVKIEENETSESTMYIAVQDKISIGNTHKSFTRIQTMAHECLHSIQDRKLLIANFIFSNIYLLFFVIMIILLIFKIIQDKMLFLNIFLIISFVYYVVKIYLENDAMIKAEYLAKEYIEEQKITTEEENEKLIKGFKELNKGCIKTTNCSIFINIMIKVIIFSALSLIF